MDRAAKAKILEEVVRGGKKTAGEYDASARQSKTPVVRTKYTGPDPDRINHDNFVSREELADFQRQNPGGTLRDLLNADQGLRRRGAPADSGSDMRARGPQGASIAPSGRADAGQYRGSIPTPIGAPTNRPEPSPPSTMERIGSGLSDTAKKILAATGATAAAGGGAYALYRAKKARDAAEAAKRAADDERLASRLEPLMRRSGEGVDEAMKQARAEMAREPQFERARAFSAAEKKAPAVQGDKAKMSPRSRTRENEEGEFKRGGAVKTYSKGGSVKGAGCEQRGLKKCKVC